MDREFVASINYRVKVLKEIDPDYFSDEMIEATLSMSNYNKEPQEITEYHLGFIDLFENNDDLQQQLQEQLALLENQDYYRQDISSGVGIMIREVRLPEDQKSKWQLLYETTVHPYEESGPILHLYFDGWELLNTKIYYWDEAYINDIEDN